MSKVSIDFKKIDIKIQDGKVIKCVIDGVEGKLLGTGNRRVYQFGKKFVVKFDSAHPRKVGDGWMDRNVKIQNEREIENYRLINEEDKKYFAAILRVGKVKGRIYVVQEYVPTTRRAFKKECEEFEKIRRKYNLADVRLDYWGKSHHNIAVNKDGFKFFDLGWEHRMRQPLF